MKPRSSEWRNVQRRLYRRYRKKLKQIPFAEICQTENSRRRAMLMEILLLKFFIAGILWMSENDFLKEKLCHPDYLRFRAQDVPIFLDPDILKELQAMTRADM